MPLRPSGTALPCLAGMRAARTSGSGRRTARGRRLYRRMRARACGTAPIAVTSLSLRARTATAAIATMTADMSIEMTTGTTFAIAIIVGMSVETTDGTSVETTGATANARATTVGRAARRRMHRDA